MDGMPRVTSQLYRMLTSVSAQDPNVVPPEVQDLRVDHPVKKDVRKKDFSDIMDPEAGQHQPDDPRSKG